MSDFYYKNFPWYVRAENEKQYLYPRRERKDWTHDEIDFQFSLDKDSNKLELGHFTQDVLEYFVEKYGENYEYLYFNNATRIKDFSPLGDLQNIKSIAIDWYRGDKLWDMRYNTKLTNIWISTSKKFTRHLSDINTCKSLENLMLNGDMDSPYTVESFSQLEDLPHLRRIDLLDIKSEDHDMSFLDKLPCLEEFHFDAGMLTTEEIAYICAKYPNLKGRSLGACTTHFTINDVRICGYRKPGLDLPQGQARLEKYIKEFNALVEKYKTELKNNT